LDRLRFVLGSRGIRNTLERTLQVGRRFGITAHKMEKRLLRYSDIAADYNARPSLPITAAVMARNPWVAQHLADRGVELCIHGYVHTDMSKLTSARQRQHIDLAIRIFKANDVDFAGFRSPYLRYNDATLAAVEAAGFEYDSNLPFYWEPRRALSNLKVHEEDGLRRGLRFYSPVTYPDDCSLPRFIGDLLEIPVSLPDDEILLDRMGWDPSGIGGVWQEMAETALERGELLTIQLHPERVELLEPSLRQVLDFAMSSGRFWFATLTEIARWWKQRTAFGIELAEAGAGTFTVSIPSETEHPVYLFDPGEGRRRLLEHGESVTTPRRPLVGVARGAGTALTNKVRDLSLLYEESADRDAYPLYLESDLPREQLVRLVRRLDHPMLADGFWPARARAALAVTGDIDCLTLGDFLRRFRED
jgi:peptidoglycan/xylan/chitin deacetylase (PgdA/CDA1 family)